MRLKKSLQLIVNNACDKKCKYCYENNIGDKSLTIDNVDNVIEKFINTDIWNRHILFFGGEPTLSLPVLRDAFNKHHNDVTFSVITNGYFLNLVDYDFMKNYSSVSVSLEGTEESYAFFRNGSNLRNVIDRLIALKWNNIIINISINGLLNHNAKEFVSNVRYILNNGLHVHLYSLKGDDFFKDLEEYIHFLKNVKNEDEDIFNMIILKDSNTSDTPFLCTFDDAISISPDNKIVKCARLNEEWITYDQLDDVKEEWANIIAHNHKDLYEGCSNCEVEIGKCQTSCPALIKELIQSSNFDLLNKLCMRERINEKLRRGEWVL